jgi:hypothetical protein
VIKSRRLLWITGTLLVLGGVGHFVGISSFYLTQGVPDPNRVLLDVWIGESQVVGGLLYLAAVRAAHSGVQWQSLAIFGAVTVICWTGPILPVLFTRVPIAFRIPPLVYFVASVWILLDVARPSARPEP